MPCSNHDIAEQTHVAEEKDNFLSAHIMKKQHINHGPLWI